MIKVINEKKTDSKIEIYCSETAKTNIVELLKHLKSMGSLGHTAGIIIDDKSVSEFDGDGSDKIRKIIVDGTEV